MPKLVFIILCCLSAAINLLCLICTFRKKTKLANTLGTAMIFSFLTVVAYILPLLFHNLFFTSFCHSIQFVFINLALLFLVKYIIVYVNGVRHSKIIFSVLIPLIVIDAVFLVSNPWHELDMTFYSLVSRGDQYFNYIKHPMFYFHLAISFLLMFIFFGIIISQFFCVAYVYAKKYFLLLSMILIPFLYETFYIYAAKPLGPNFSYVFFAAYCVILYIFTFTWRPTLLIKESRSRIFSYIAAPIVFFNNEDILSDINECALRVLPIEEKEKNKLSLDMLLERLKLSHFPVSGELESSMEMSLSRGSRTFHYQVNYKLLRDSHDRILGRLFVFYDLTKNTEMLHTLEHLANVDSLTGLNNKYHFNNSVGTYDSEQNFPLSIVVFDIDGLKTINSIFGDSMGDHVIWYTATSIRSMLPDHAYLARIDGDETILLLPETTEIQAADLARSIVNHVEHGHNFEFELSLAYGIACKTSEASGSIQQLLSIARNNMECKKLLNRRSEKSALVDSLMKTLNQSDFETEEHCNRVKVLSHNIGIRMGLSESDLTALELLAMLHDIGKLSVPINILRKPGKLTEKEWALMQQHSIKGYHITNTSQELSIISNLVLCHHEHWDGSGYPNAMKGTEIPLLSRIISVVDAFDVMTHDRPYHSAIPVTDAIAELKRCSGQQFDPEIVQVVVDLYENT